MVWNNIISKRVALAFMTLGTVFGFSSQVAASQQDMSIEITMNGEKWQGNLERAPLPCRPHHPCRPPRPLRPRRPGADEKRRPEVKERKPRKEEATVQDPAVDELLELTRDIHRVVVGAGKGVYKACKWGKRQLGPVQDAFWHVSLGLNSNDELFEDDEFDDGLTLTAGRRWIHKHGHALDVSVTYRQDEREYFDNDWQAYRREVRRSFSLPRVMYYKYFNHKAKSSVYVGGGLSSGTLITEKDNFFGAMAHASVGYEMGRKDSVRRNLELHYTQAIIPYEKDDYSAENHTVALSFGIGF